MHLGSREQQKLSLPTFFFVEFFSITGNLSASLKALSHFAIDNKPKQPSNFPASALDCKNDAFIFDIADDALVYEETHHLVTPDCKSVPSWPICKLIL